MTEVHAQHLGNRVRERRRELKLTQAEVQKRGGPSTATLRLIEGGKHTDFRAATAEPLEEILQWQKGSIAATLKGGEPTLVSAAPAPTNDSVLEMSATLWEAVTDLADSSDEDPRRNHKGERAVVAAADLLIEILLALNAGPPAKGLIREMSNTAYEILDLDQEEDDDVSLVLPSDETPQSTAPPEAVKDEEAASRDDSKLAGAMNSAMSGAADRLLDPTKKVAVDGDENPEETQEVPS